MREYKIETDGQTENEGDTFCLEMTRLPCNLSEETGSERIQNRVGQTESQRDTFCLEMTRLHCNFFGSAADRFGEEIACCEFKLAERRAEPCCRTGAPAPASTATGHP